MDWAEEKVRTLLPCSCSAQDDPDRSHASFCPAWARRREKVATALRQARARGIEEAKRAQCWLCELGTPMKDDRNHDCGAVPELKHWPQFDKCKASAIRALKDGGPDGG